MTFDSVMIRRQKIQPCVQPIWTADETRTRGLKMILNEFRGVGESELTAREKAVLRLASDVLGVRTGLDQFGQITIPRLHL